MEESILFISLLLLGGATLAYRLLKDGTRTQAWQDAAVSCGLQATEVPNVWRLPIEAGAGWAEVRFEAGGDKGGDTRIAFKGPGPPDFEMVRIRPEALFQWTRDFEIGDGPFDRAFFIEGPLRPVLALLDVETRRLLLRLSSESQLEIHLGEIRAQMTDGNVRYLLPLLLDIGRRFVRSMDVSQRLAENAHHDPEARVRFQNLLVLIREFPGEPQTIKALRTSCLDTNLQIRLRAAKELGVEGHGALLKIAEGLADDVVSAEAVSILGQALPFERVLALLGSARGRRQVQTARACLKVLGQSGDPAAVDVLAQVMTVEKGEIAAAAAQILGETGGPAAEPLLIPILQHEEKALRLAAASALGHIGSVEAVLPLKEMATRFRLDFDLDLAARQAIAEIQSRIQGASPGQISLAGAEAGRLSLTEAEAGQLSIADDPAGRLSLDGTKDKPEKPG